MNTMDFYKAEIARRTITGDLLAHTAPVVPIKTGGRAYGSISRQLQARGITLPSLRPCQAVYQAPYIFVALWDDEDRGYSDKQMRGIASVVMSCACAAQLEEVALPYFAGWQAKDVLWVMEQTLEELAETRENMGFAVPEHVYVTDKNVG